MGKIKAVLITASRRKKSNSKILAYYFLKALSKNNDYSVTHIDITSKKIKQCIACKRCAKTFRCFQRDDAQKIIDKIEKASVVIVASPVYFCGVPGPLKMFIDRNQPQWEKNNRQLPIANRQLKAGVIILTAGDDKPEYFRAAEQEIKSFFAVNRIKTAGVLKAGGMDRQGAAGKIRKKAEKFAGKTWRKQR